MPIFKPIELLLEVTTPKYVHWTSKIRSLVEKNESLKTATLKDAYLIQSSGKLLYISNKCLK